MDNLEVTPSAVHNIAADVSDVAASLRTAATELTTGGTPAPDDFRTTAALAQLLAKWAEDTAAEADAIDNLATAIHESAAIIQRTDAEAAQAGTDMANRIKAL